MVSTCQDPCISIARVPSICPYEINRLAIQNAIQQQSQILVQLDNISQHLFDYLVLAQSNTEANRILSTPLLHIGIQILAISPWTPQHGSITVPFDGNIPNFQKIARRPRSPGNNEPLRLVISRMPPHLMQPIVIPRIFANIQPSVDNWKPLIFSNIYGHFGFMYKHIHRGINRQSSTRRMLTAVMLALLKYPFYPLFILDNGMNLISKSLTVLTPA